VNEKEDQHGATLRSARGGDRSHLGGGLAIRQRIPATDVKEVLFAYPTDGSDVRFML
jgi:hypothetical protein